MLVTTQPYLSLSVGLVEAVQVAGGGNELSRELTDDLEMGFENSDNHTWPFQRLLPFAIPERAWRSYLAGSKKMAPFHGLKNIWRDVRLSREVGLGERLLHFFHVHKTQGPLVA